MVVKILGMLAVVAASTGCINTPPSQTSRPGAAIQLPADIASRVDQMRGCWIAREGSGATILRLLPPSVGASTIEGGVNRTGTTTADRVASLSFTRDGASATLTAGDTSPETFLYDRPDWAPSGRAWLVYRSMTAAPLFLLIEAPGETLRIMTTLGPNPGPMAMSPLYEGKRDGCD